jgi:hypothetical protein
LAERTGPDYTIIAQAEEYDEGLVARSILDSSRRAFRPRREDATVPAGTDDSINFRAFFNKQDLLNLLILREGDSWYLKACGPSTAA